MVVSLQSGNSEFEFFDLIVIGQNFVKVGEVVDVINYNK